MMHATTPLISRVARAVIFALANATLIFSSVSVADEHEDEISLFEEIVVTAQKRAQDIMDVPVAVSAVTGRQIEEAGIKDVFDMMQNVPSLVAGQSQTSTTSNFSIRGIGSTSNNFGVESAVGLYVDGVYRSRQSSIINELADIERVEVLRGPQGTLFGKNTPAGAISITSVRPGQERDAYFDVTAGDYGLVRVSAAANIPISDNLAFRGTLFSSQRDGYGDDLALGEDVYNDRDRYGVRLQLGYEPSDSFNMRIIADYSEIDETCCIAVSFIDGLFDRSTLSTPGSDLAFLSFGGTIFTDYPYPQPLIDFIELAVPQGNLVTGVGWEDYVTAYSFLPVSQNEDSGLSVEFNKTFGNGSTLTSISALRAFETFDHIDADFADVDMLIRDNLAEQSSFSQELRLSGTFGETGNYVLGAYYFGQEIDQVTDTIGTPLLEAYLNGATSSVVSVVNAIYAISQDVYESQGLESPFLLANIGFPPNSTISQDNILQDQDGFALFGHVDFSLAENLTLALGARYTDETKKIDAQFTQGVDPISPVPDFGLIALYGCILTACHPDAPAFDPAVLFDPTFIASINTFSNAGWGVYVFPPLAPRPPLNTQLDDDQVTYTGKLSWHVNDSSMLYLSYSTGFKSGGTNTERIAPVFNSLFQAETSKSFEIGYKADIGPVRLAVTVYDTVFEDFQAQTFTGTGFNLQNAGEIDNQGYEVEMLIRPTDTLQFQVNYSHNEAEYASHENGTCWDTYTFHTGIPDPGLPPTFRPGLDQQICSKTGLDLADNPVDRLFVAAQQSLNLTDNTSLLARLEYSFFSDQFTDGDLDPFTFQDDIRVVNARIGLNFDASNSNVTLWARNLTDERYHHGTFDAPFQAGRMNAYPSEPSTWGLTYRKNFD